MEVSARQRDVVEAHRHTEATEITDFTRRNGATEANGVVKLDAIAHQVAAGRASRGMDREKAGITSRMDPDGL